MPNKLASAYVNTATDALPSGRLRPCSSPNAPHTIAARDKLRHTPHPRVRHEVAREPRCRVLSRVTPPTETRNRVPSELSARMYVGCRASDRKHGKALSVDLAALLSGDRFRHHLACWNAIALATSRGLRPSITRERVATHGPGLRGGWPVNPARDPIAAEHAKAGPRPDWATCAGSVVSCARRTPRWKGKDRPPAGASQR